jgi:hypothetical protein
MPVFFSFFLTPVAESIDFISWEGCPLVTQGLEEVCDTL